MLHKRWKYLFAAMAIGMGAVVGISGATFAHALPNHGHGHLNSAAHRDQGDRSSRTVTLTGRLSETRHGIVLTTSQGRTYRLLEGPQWYADSVFKALQGQSATVVGRQTGLLVHVQTMNGQAVRGHGKPPWAGVRRGAHH